MCIGTSTVNWEWIQYEMSFCTCSLWLISTLWWWRAPVRTLNVAHASRFSTHRSKTQLLLMGNAQNEGSTTALSSFIPLQKAYLFCGIDRTLQKKIPCHHMHATHRCRSNMRADYFVFNLSSRLTSTFNPKEKGWDMFVSVKFTYVHEHF